VFSPSGGVSPPEAGRSAVVRRARPRDHRGKGRVVPISRAPGPPGREGKTPGLPGSSLMPDAAGAANLRCSRSAPGTRGEAKEREGGPRAARVCRLPGRAYRRALTTPTVVALSLLCPLCSRVVRARCDLASGACVTGKVSGPSMAPRGRRSSSPRPRRPRQSSARALIGLRSQRCIAASGCRRMRTAGVRT
jgi:hypothetical protein